MTTFQVTIVLLIMAAIVAFYETRKGWSPKRKETKITLQSAAETLSKMGVKDIENVEDRGICFRYDGKDYLIEVGSYPLIRIAYGEELDVNADFNAANKAAKDLNEIASSVYLYLDERDLMFCYPSIIPSCEVLEESFPPIAKYIQAATEAFRSHYKSEEDKNNTPNEHIK